MSGLETVEGSVGPQLRSLPPWSRRGQSGGLTWHGRCTAGHPPPLTLSWSGRWEGSDDSL